VDALFAPRRTVLDRALADTAMEAGVAFSYGTSLQQVTTASGRVTGVIVRPPMGWDREIGARVVVGADGMRSTVARLVGASLSRAGRAAAAVVFGYWSHVPVDGYRWYYSPGLSVGAIPTNDGLTCIFASAPANRFAELFKGDVARGYTRVIAETAPDLAEATAHGALVGTLHGFPGQPGFFRRASGPGWALAGDAGYFKDPITAHGITDALIEAEYLGRAIASGTDAALAAYERDRDVRTAALFDVTDRIASFAWSLDEVRTLHKALAEAMSTEVSALQERTHEVMTT
jgi:flavin-dependent dehydrogenase